MADCGSLRVFEGIIGASAAMLTGVCLIAGSPHQRDDATLSNLYLPVISLVQVIAEKGFGFSTEGGCGGAPWPPRNQRDDM